MRSTNHPQDDLLIVEALHGHGHEIEDSRSLAHKNVDRGNHRVPTPPDRRIHSFTTRH